MKTFLALTFWLVVLLLIPTPRSFVLAGEPLFLSLVQTSGDSTNDDFIEIRNESDTRVSLQGYSLRRKTKSDATPKGASIKSFGASDSIPAHGSSLWANSSSVFKDFADTTTGTSLTADNSIALFDKDGVMIDALTWGDDHVAPFVPKNLDNLTPTLRAFRAGPAAAWATTAGIEPRNSRGETWTPPAPPPIDPPTGSIDIRINEVFPNPKEKGDVGEFIELYNFGFSTVDLSGWTIRDASKTGRYTFPSERLIEAGQFLVLTDSDFTLSLNNSNETVSLSDRGGNIVHSVSYEKSKEGVTLNLVAGKLRGGRMPTPGKHNRDNTDPVTKERVPKKGYKNIALEFRARGDDADGDALKFTWDFGDGHKSYKEKTTHQYEKTGKYEVTLTTDDGVDVTTETFSLKIDKYEPPKIRIVAFLPNPEGKDTENEWVEIENRSDKEVNLRGFGIATGTKRSSLVNHPIRDDLVIKKKQILRLTRDDALFSLPNKKGRLELRAPNGDVLQKFSYSFPDTLSDDVVVKKEKGKKELSLVTPQREELTSPEEEVRPASAPTKEILGDTPAEERRVDPESLDLQVPKEESSLPASALEFSDEEGKENIETLPLAPLRNFLEQINGELNAFLYQHGEQIMLSFREWSGQAFVPLLSLFEVKE